MTDEDPTGKNSAQRLHAQWCGSSTTTVPWQEWLMQSGELSGQIGLLPLVYLVDMQPDILSAPDPSSLDCSGDRKECGGLQQEHHRVDKCPNRDGSPAQGRRPGGFRRQGVCRRTVGRGPGLCTRRQQVIGKPASLSARLPCTPLKTSSVRLLDASSSLNSIDQGGYSPSGHRGL